MSRNTVYTATCDVDTTTTADMPNESNLPQGWLNLQGALFGLGAQNGNNIDVCPTCLEQLTALPPQWQALIPAPPA